MGDFVNFVYFLLAVLNLHTCTSDDIHWTYKAGGLDEAHWGEKFPDCAKNHQSPVNIERKKVRHNITLRPLELSGFEGQQDSKFLMKNTGHSVQIDLPPTMAITKGLPSRYTATQMHLHWGGMNLEASGSEHTIDGMRYMAELHIVHYNSDKYASFAEAKDKADGLAVLAFIYEDGHFENTYYSDFIANLEKIQFTDQSTYISSLNVRAMLPENLSNFFRYQGSLTTPPCYESIIWTVYDTPITLSLNQIRIMENALMDHRNKTLRNDYRHVQPLNDRVIEASFLPRFGGSVRHSRLQDHTEQTYIAPLAFHFTEKSFMSYAQVHLVHSMALRSFTACMHVKAGTTGVHTILSYSGFQNDNELVISTGAEVGLWIGGHFVNFPLNHRSQEVLHYCITWASHSGGAELWVNGVVGEEKHVRRGYVLQSGGTFILGKDQDGILGISESDSFVGHMSDVNIWDYILSSSEIRELMKCSNVRSKGNVVGWGIHRVDVFGGVRLERDTRCG
ncbi:carbonic anhydrase 6-like isoform X2 [Acipenser ruthenus]|uniref:carbonic anhydrase 6-like isoform X2 n=1 Tax=Acipenser ruthenus TaxID=7906 RepID=UPI00274268FF|nr:carbonic anhydrase 6-like isoform X2 [Acipenser ruthenus]